MMKSAKWAWTAVCLLLVLGLAACGGKTAAPAAGTEPTARPAQATAAPAQAAATPATATQAPAAGATQPTAAPTAEPTEETLSLNSRAEGLDKLKSYRARWLSEWNGIEGDKQVTVSWDWIEEYTSEPEALHFKFASTSSDTSSSQGIIEIWRIGDTSYMVTGEAGKEPQCITISSEDQTGKMERGLFNPSSLGSLQNARYVGMDTVNGIRARHYKYNEKTADLVGFSKVDGEIWVAVDGGYVVKDTMQWEGGRGFLSVAADAGQGKGQWIWELSDVNQRIVIEPPADCESAASDLPLLPDATEKATFGDLISYKTATRLADAVKFYQEKMPAAGWKTEGEPMITDAFAQLSFTKDEQTAQIIISTDGDKAQVMISVQK